MLIGSGCQFLNGLFKLSINEDLLKLTGFISGHKIARKDVFFEDRIKRHERCPAGIFSPNNLAFTKKKLQFSRKNLLIRIACLPLPEISGQL